MTDIRELAKRERRAETSRKTAEGKWRQAWWQTTLTLGSLDRKARFEACSVVVKATGQSREWVLERARLGAAFYEAGYHEITGLPPRMAVEMIRNKVEVNDQTIATLKQAEESGMSLREYSASLSGKSWSDTPAGASKETIQEIVAKHPKLVAQIITDTPERRVIVHQALASRYPTVPQRFTTVEEAPLEIVIAVRHLKKDAVRLTELLSTHSHNLSPAERDAVEEQVQWMRNAATLWESCLRSGSMDDELFSILAGE